MPTLSTLKNLAIAGLTGQIIFEFYAWFVSPVLFGTALEPSNLVKGLAKMGIGVDLSYGGAFVIHFLIGSFGFAAFVYVIKRLTSTSYFVSGVIGGLALWFIAQGMLAPLLGRSFMMGFGAYTQSSFVAHVGMTIIMAMIWQYLERRNTNSPTPVVA
jgi:hypothetical protein